MSSPLDGRIRKLAREEAEATLGGRTADGAPGRDDLQQQITDLHEHLHHTATVIKRLEDRLNALEARPTVRRAARKDANG